MADPGSFAIKGDGLRFTYSSLLYAHLDNVLGSRNTPLFTCIRICPTNSLVSRSGYVLLVLSMVSD